METKRIEECLRKYGIKSNMFAMAESLLERRKAKGIYKVLLRCRCARCLRINLDRRLAYAKTGIKLGYSDLDPHKYDYLENE